MSTRDGTPGAPPASGRARTRSASTRLALVAAAAVPVCGLLELGASLWMAKRTPTYADWDASRPRVLALKEQVSGVVVAPWWAEPHARRAYGESILPLRDVARADESRYARLLEVSVGGERLPETAGFRVVSEEPLAHGLRARVLENPAPARPTFDFTDHVADGRASVAFVVGPREDACDFRTGEPVVAPGLFGHPAIPPARFVCGRTPLASVGVTVHDDERFRARRCVLSQPPDGGAVRLRFADVPLGDVIRGHMSIHWTLEREKRGAPVFLEVAIDGERVGEVKHLDGEGWAPGFTIPLGSRARSTAREVTFSLRSSGRDRQVCWEADAR